MIRRPYGETKVQVCECGQKAAIQIDSIWYCAWCYSKTYCLEGPIGVSKLRAACKQHHLGIRNGETREEYITRCKQIIFNGKTDFMGKLKESFARLDYFPVPGEDEFPEL